MGITKNYLRYSHEATFGVIAASQVGASINFLKMRGTVDRFVAVPANEAVLFWDLKTKQVINKLDYDTDNAAEVTIIDCYHGGHPRTNLIAVGYANGHIRIFEYESGDLKSTFTGHRTSISAMKFDKDGSRLASGSKDCNIVIWDMITEKGLFSLKGHKNSISKLQFLYNDEYQKDLLLSSSIDAVSTIKIWDLQTQHCFCTIPGQAYGVWSFALIKEGSLLVTGTSSPELRVYSIEFMQPNDSTRADLGSTDENLSSESDYGVIVRHIGNILRNSNSVSNRVQDLVVDESENVMICHSTDNNLELYSLRSDEEALKYAKKQAKKQNRRQSKRKRDLNECQEDETEHDAPDLTQQPNSLKDLQAQSIVDSRFNKKLGSHKLGAKIKAVSIIKASGKFKICVMHSTNMIGICSLDPSIEDKDKMFVEQEKIETFSHRSDVRAIAMSPDRSLIMTVSAEALKIWRTETRSCITTVDVDHPTCCTFANADHLSGSFKNRFALVGTKRGDLQVVDLTLACVMSSSKLSTDDKPITSICVKPDQSGVFVGGDDGVSRLLDYAWEPVETDDVSLQTSLVTREDRTLQFQEGITNVKMSPNGNLLAVALLDSTVRIHFVDTFKYFLTMYGHKFPVTAMDISDDNTLLVTGSPDKNIKIWGLDFGDCHKSIFAHDEAITCLKFVPKTHFVFSCGRDRSIKQWDCDHFIKVQTLRKHQGEVWCLDVSSNGKLIVTGSHDKSIRAFRRTEEILVPSDEEETERELDDERNVFEKQENIIIGESNTETGFAAKMTIETVKSTDRLLEAIDVFSNEQEKEIDYKKQCELADTKGEPRPPEPERDPLLLTIPTTDYRRFILEILRRIKSSELEEVLITLPFDYVRKLLIILALLLDLQWDVELLTRSATFLLRVNFGQIAACAALVPVISKLNSTIKGSTHRLLHLTGFNMITIEHLKQNRKISRKNSTLSLY